MVIQEHITITTHYQILPTPSHNGCSVHINGVRASTNS